MESELIVSGYFEMKVCQVCHRGRAQQLCVFGCGFLGLGQGDSHMSCSALPRIHTSTHNLTHGMISWRKTYLITSHTFTQTKNHIMWWIQPVLQMKNLAFREISWGDDWTLLAGHEQRTRLRRSNVKVVTRNEWHRRRAWPKRFYNKWTTIWQSLGGETAPFTLQRLVVLNKWWMNLVCGETDGKSEIRKPRLSLSYFNDASMIIMVPLKTGVFSVSVMGGL